MRQKELRLKPRRWVERGERVAKNEDKTVRYRGETDAERAALEKAKAEGASDEELGIKPDEETVQRAEEAAEQESDAKAELREVERAAQQMVNEQRDAVNVLVDERRRRQERRNEGEEPFPEDAEE